MTNSTYHVLSIIDFRPKGIYFMKCRKKAKSKSNTTYLPLRYSPVWFAIPVALRMFTS